MALWERGIFDYAGPIQPQGFYTVNGRASFLLPMVQERIVDLLTVESDVLMAILKLTKESSILHENINKHVRLPSSLLKKLLQELQDDGLVYVRGKKLDVAGVQRLELAVRALSRGADLENVSSLLQWKEFEAMTGIAFENNGYLITKNLRFKHDARRYEIDVVGYRRPLVVCVDCKHWHHSIGKATLEKIAKDQTARVRALSNALPHLNVRLEFYSWSSARFVPVILSLVVGESKFCAGVPVVPILKLQDFLNQLPAYVESMAYIDLKHAGNYLFIRSNCFDLT